MVEPKKSKKEIKTPKKVITSTPAAGKQLNMKKNLTTITKCDCKNEYQDKLYGNGMRLKNSSTKGFRCSVCRKIG